MTKAVICIDGPAGAGKTTVAKAIADELGYLYLDTGVLYRAVALVAARGGVPPWNGARLAELARSTDIQVKPAPRGDVRQTLVFADGEDVSLEIRTPEVDAHVSEVSAHPEVREALMNVQRAFAARGGVVLAGRDTGTIIWPKAEVKLYLDGSAEERANRRLRQAAEQGKTLDFEWVLSDLRRRDEFDSSRAVAPLRPAEDAVILDTTELTEQQVIRRALEIARERTSPGRGSGGR